MCLKLHFELMRAIINFLSCHSGLTNASFTFQSLMNEVFKPYLRKFVLIFFDDILVYSRSWKDHLSHLNLTLEALKQSQLYVKKSKYSFAKQQLEYLGHLISEKGVATNPTKVECMKQWPRPKSLKFLRRFLGLTGYYRRFIRNYRKISCRFTNLLKKDNFHWSAEVEKAFEKLKVAMSFAPVPAMPDFSKQLLLSVMHQMAELRLFLCKRKGPLLLLARHYHQKIQVYQPMKGRCWQQYLLYKNGDRICWETVQGMH